MNEIFWPTALGAAIGVAAGVIIQYLFQMLVQFVNRRNGRKSFHKECTFNISVADEIGTALRQYRDAISVGAPQAAQTYLPCHRGLHIQITSLISSGTLYDFFTDEDLRKLQMIVQFMSATTGTWFQAELDRRKQMLISAPTADTMAETVQFLNYADGKVRDVRQQLLELQRSLR